MADSCAQHAAAAVAAAAAAAATCEERQCWGRATHASEDVSVHSTHGRGVKLLDGLRIEMGWQLRETMATARVAKVGRHLAVMWPPEWRDGVGSLPWGWRDLARLGGTAWKCYYLASMVGITAVHGRTGGHEEPNGMLHEIYTLRQATDCPSLPSLLCTNERVLHILFSCPHATKSFLSVLQLVLTFFLCSQFPPLSLSPAFPVLLTERPCCQVDVFSCLAHWEAILPS
jgi:hypothetical protein